MIQMLSVSFQLKRLKANPLMQAPIYVRLTINSVRTEFSLKRRIDIGKWNNKAGIAKGNTEDIRSLNVYLASVRDRLYRIHQSLIDQGKPATVNSIKNAFLGIDDPGKRIMELFHFHNSQMKALVPAQYAPGTLERYNTAKAHLQEYIQAEYKEEDLPLKLISYEFVRGFEFFLKTQKRCCHNTTMKYITNLKKVVNLAVNSGYIDKNPFSNFKIHLHEVHRDFLNDTEIKAIANHHFHSERLRQVADVFLFACCTGLSYADLKKLSSSHIVVDLDGTKWIKLHRTKTDTISRIPVLPPAEVLLKKYSHYAQVQSGKLLLPVISNQKLNEYLTEIGTLTGIGKKLTMHVGRHTCATMMLTYGVPLETVSEILGHTHLPTTRKYAKLVDLKIKQDVNLVSRAVEQIFAGNVN